MKIVNLIYFKDSSQNGNFGDELSKFITTQLINKDKNTPNTIVITAIEPISFIVSIKLIYI